MAENRFWSDTAKPRIPYSEGAIVNPTMPIAAVARTCFTLALALFLGDAVSESRAQIKPLNFTTPTYIELELAEVRTFEDRATVTINLFRTGEFRVLTKVDFVTEEETATEGRDYKGAGGTVVFQPGEGHKSIVLELIADDEEETEESFSLRLSCSSPDVVFGADSARIVLQDQPRPISNPALTIVPAEDGQVQVSWAGSPEGVLEVTSDPAGDVWTTLSCSVENDSGNCHALVSAAQARGFFRLRVR